MTGSYGSILQPQRTVHDRIVPEAIHNTVPVKILVF